MTLSIDTYRENDAPCWDLPAFELPLSAGVMPLFYRLKHSLFPIGTAFLISKFGVVATAAHCVREALKHHYRGADRFQPGDSYDISDVGFCVLHVCDEGSSRRFWSIENIQVAHPTDVAFGYLYPIGAPSTVFTPRLTFEIPPKGATVRAIGYKDVRPDDGTLDIEQMRNGSFNWSQYSHRFVAAAGPVRAAVTQRHSKGYVEGPCLLTDCPTDHGMSGGPVFNERGDICALVSASDPSVDSGSLLSLLYPTLAVELHLTARPHSKVTMNLKTPLVLAIQQGLIRTDGTERLHTLASDSEGRIRVDPAIERVKAVDMFEDVHGFIAGTPAIPLAPDGPDKQRGRGLTGSG